ncbi:TPA: sodium:calcium antiporter [Candidatus Micrarchaeota archaeon]|nr:sodium:calcium antiporter [Candidatus Micrarchaeota archaeon]
MLLELLLLLSFIVLLSKSATIVVDNVYILSRFFNIGTMAIGFILLSVSTSLPELSVSVVSSTVGEGAIAAGNVFGSNIANILLVLGAGAILYGFKIRKEDLRDVGFVLLLTTVLSAYIIFNSSIQGQVLGGIEGVVLLLLFVLYVVYTLLKKRVADGSNNSVTKHKALRAFLLFCLGILLVFISSGFVVEYAVSLASAAGVARSFIGATIIAIGTSLPELSVDLQAIRKRHYGMALGDAIGSNMTNLTLVLGTAAAIHPIDVKISVFIAALLFAIVANMLLLYVGAIRGEMKKMSGIVFILFYAIYIASIFWLQASELDSFVP